MIFKKLILPVATLVCLLLIQAAKGSAKDGAADASTTNESKWHHPKPFDPKIREALDKMTPTQLNFFYDFAEGYIRFAHCFPERAQSKQTEQDQVNLARLTAQEEVLNVPKNNSNSSAG